MKRMTETTLLALRDEALSAVTGGKLRRPKPYKPSGRKNEIGSITVSVDGDSDVVVVGNQAGGNQTFSF